MKEYKLAKGWAIFIYIFAPVLIVLFGWLLLMPIIPGMENERPDKFYWFFIVPLSVSLIALMTVGLFDTVKSKVIITSDTLSSRSTFINRDLKFDEIKGFRVTDNYIFVEPVSADKKRIKISTYVGKCDELIWWLASNFPDLDQVNLEKEQREIIDNDRYGLVEEERIEKLKQARLTAKRFNLAGVIVAVWILIFPKPYEYAIIAAISVPVIAILATFLFKGLIKISEEKSGAYPAIFRAVFFPSVALCLRAMFDFNIVDFTNVWKPSILILAALVILIALGTKEFKLKRAKDYIIILALSVYLFAYSYGTVIILNCYYDTAQSVKFETKILAKRVDSGKTTDYYFKLTAWGSQSEADEVSVSKSLYRKLDKDDMVNIYYKRGLFEIPWFIIAE